MKRATRGLASHEEGAPDEGAEEEQGGWFSLDCLPDILKRLGQGDDSAQQLAKTRMVCSHWSKAALGTVTNWDMVFKDEDRDMFRALRHFSSLRELTIYINNSGLAESFNELISAACSLENLKSLKISYAGSESQYSLLLPALMPLIPRLETLKFTAHNYCNADKAPDALVLTQALAAASNLRELDVSVHNRGKIILDPISFTHMPPTGVPVEGLAALPSSLTRLRIDHVAFGQGQSLQTLPFMPLLEELWIGSCTFDGAIGLRCATALKSLTLCSGVELKESDLDDVLTIRGLKHLRLSNNITSSFVRRLPSKMRSLESLSLCRWKTVSEVNMESLGILTSLTSLDISAPDDIAIMVGGMVPEWLRHLSTLTLLQRLVLQNHNAEGFLDRGLPRLHALPALKSLDLGGVVVDNAEVMKLLPPGLEHLSMSRCFNNENVHPYVPCSAMNELQKQCQNLVSVDLSYNPYMNIMNGVGHLSSLQQLQQVIINDEMQEEAEDDGSTDDYWLSGLGMHLRHLSSMLSVMRKTKNSAMHHHLRWDIREREDRASVVFHIADEVVKGCRELCQEWEPSVAPL